MNLDTVHLLLVKALLRIFWSQIIRKYICNTLLFPLFTMQVKAIFVNEAETNRICWELKIIDIRTLFGFQGLFSAWISSPQKNRDMIGAL